MIEQFFLAKNRLAAAPEQGVWKTKRTAASRGCQRRQAPTLHAPGRGEPLLEHRTLVSCPFLGFPTRPCVKASGEGKDPA